MKSKSKNKVKGVYEQQSNFPLLTDEEIGRMFKRIDHNSDGKLTRIELIKNLRTDPMTYRILQIPKNTVDGNRERFEAVFQDMDVDEDQAIELSEFTAYIKAQ